MYDSMSKSKNVMDTVNYSKFHSSSMWRSLLKANFGSTNKKIYVYPSSQHTHSTLAIAHLQEKIPCNFLNQNSDVTSRLSIITIYNTQPVILSIYIEIDFFPPLWQNQNSQVTLYQIIEPTFLNSKEYPTHCHRTQTCNVCQESSSSLYLLG